ncbi:hypothetical protein ACS0TY_029945 [Phlomoides rotata]
MPPKRIPATANIVDLDSDEEGGAGPPPGFYNTHSKPSISAKLQNKPPTTITTLSTSTTDGGAAVAANCRPLDNRSFWKAGAYEIGPARSTVFQGDLEHARVHPKFLHSNATSHKWAFGAIAELLDNAVDEIENGATFVNVDRIYNTKDNSPALLFQDDGGGMNPECMRKCMSLGYSSKTSNTTIGQYGNGFKTSTMRLGADVIVFSRANQSGRATQSVGLLSYTFLRRTRQDDVIVPMIDFDISDNWAVPIIYSSNEDWSSNLKTILEWSPFTSKDDLLLQFENIGSHGTKIIIYNLWMNDEGIYELNFDDDDEDIRLRDEANQGNAPITSKKDLEQRSHLSYRMRFSLRATVETIIGFIKEAPALGVCGFNVYHKNRLIRPYWKVTADGHSRGFGVVGMLTDPKFIVMLLPVLSVDFWYLGVLEANYIEPAHDKQDFERSTLYVKLEARLKQMVSDYWYPSRAYSFSFD